MQPINHDRSVQENPTPYDDTVNRTENIMMPVESAIFSIQKSEMDYITWKGIESRTGIEKSNAFGFAIKELLDNGADILEVQAADPQIKQADQIIVLR